MIEITLAEDGLPENGSVFQRTAARGIVLREGKLLAIHTDRGDYKFPGGGVEPAGEPGTSSPAGNAGGDRL